MVYCSTKKHETIAWLCMRQLRSISSGWKYVTDREGEISQDIPYMWILKK